ncbi:hypothetical protein BUALT_Bualt18G0029000 [Buddleja alternifolia]|uniref:Protein kinase domain-containing protein n=1 Tax=Buddleja alternifolia TaxID=168488 RepID=A0AAV6WAL1_9LAMI|nr:hypothetical protein BUALT_Bualt18G0029000 [Buddleja alternifolia]
MGCVCGKASPAMRHSSNSKDSPKQRELNKKTSELRVARAISSKRDNSIRLKENLENGDIRIGLIDKKVNNGSRRMRRDDELYDKKRDIICEGVNNFPGMPSVPKAIEAEQIAAGWPSWLVAVAGEAIRGWIPRRADTFEKLDKIGQGTYSSVYKGRDLVHNKVVALKKVRFDSMDTESVKFMAREILILRRLDHPNIIKLEGLVTSKTSSSLYLVLEYMEHDLTGLASLPGVKFTESQVKCYMQQLLSGLDCCHSNGILHRDIKGSNLLIDNRGILKISDFGLASFYDNHKSVQQTSRVVTLWYRPPELLLGATHYGVAVDLWSAGCILGELYAGKPIMPGRTEVEQLHKIFKLCGSPSEDFWRKSKLPHSTVFKPIQPYRRRIAETYKDLPDSAVGLMEILLSVDPSGRGTAASALKNEFFSTTPLACDPSSLPKYPPSKEIDAKLREDEARRQGALGVKGQRGENDSRRSRDLRPDANADLVRSMQRRNGYPNPKGRSNLFNPLKEEVAKETSKDHLPCPPQGRDFHSGPLGRRNDKTSIFSTRNNLSTRSDLFPSQIETTESFGDPIRKQDHRKHHSQIFSGSQQIPYGRVNKNEPIMQDGHGCKERNVHFSGPISNNIEEVLKEHDRRIQRLRQDKTRPGSRVRPNVG